MHRGEGVGEGAGRVSGGCGRLRLKQSDECNDKRSTEKGESNDISLTTCNSLPPLSLPLLSVLFSSTQLAVLAMKREKTFGRCCRWKEKSYSTFILYIQTCKQSHLISSLYKAVMFKVIFAIWLHI